MQGIMPNLCRCLAVDPALDVRDTFERVDRRRRRRCTLLVLLAVSIPGSFLARSRGTLGRLRSKTTTYGFAGYASFSSNPNHYERIQPTGPVYMMTVPPHQLRAVGMTSPWPMTRDDP
jgi:hypothetical protein